MAPLITLLVTFAIAAFVLRSRRDLRLAGRVALAVMLIVTGGAHFTDTASLVAMVPAQVPAATAMVYLTGVAEFVFAALLLVRESPVLGRVLALFFVLLFPANIYSALAEVGLGGHGASYLWFRVPLQILFIVWALVCTNAPHRSPDSSSEIPR